MSFIKKINKLKRLTIILMCGHNQILFYKHIKIKLGPFLK